MWLCTHTHYMKRARVQRTLPVAAAVATAGWMDVLQPEVRAQVMDHVMADRPRAALAMRALGHTSQQMYAETCAYLALRDTVAARAAGSEAASTHACIVCTTRSAASVLVTVLEQGGGSTAAFDDFMHTVAHDQWRHVHPHMRQYVGIYLGISGQAALFEHVRRAYISSSPRNVGENTLAFHACVLMGLFGCRAPDAGARALMAALNDAHADDFAHIGFESFVRLRCVDDAGGSGTHLQVLLPGTQVPYAAWELWQEAFCMYPPRLTPPSEHAETMCAIITWAITRGFRLFANSEHARRQLTSYKSPTLALVYLRYYHPVFTTSAAAANHDSMHRALATMRTADDAVVMARVLIEVKKYPATSVACLLQELRPVFEHDALLPLTAFIGALPLKENTLCDWIRTAFHAGDPETPQVGWLRGNESPSVLCNMRRFYMALARASKRKSRNVHNTLIVALPAPTAAEMDGEVASYIGWLAADPTPWIVWRQVIPLYLAAGMFDSAAALRRQADMDDDDWLPMIKAAYDLLPPTSEAAARFIARTRDMVALADAVLCDESVLLFYLHYYVQFQWADCLSEAELAATADNIGTLALTESLALLLRYLPRASPAAPAFLWTVMSQFARRSTRLMHYRLVAFCAAIDAWDADHAAQWDAAPLLNGTDDELEITSIHVRFFRWAVARGYTVFAPGEAARWIAMADMTVVVAKWLLTECAPPRSDGERARVPWPRFWRVIAELDNAAVAIVAVHVTLREDWCPDDFYGHMPLLRDPTAMVAQLLEHGFGLASADPVLHLMARHGGTPSPHIASVLAQLGSVADATPLIPMCILASLARLAVTDTVLARHVKHVMRAILVPEALGAIVDMYLSRGLVACVKALGV